MSATDTTELVCQPYTGEEYLDSLRDGREVWLNGERVEDVTTHPAFRNSARSVARIYDALHDPAHQEKLLLPADGLEGRTHAYFRGANTVHELVAGRDAIVEWQRFSYGFMGRSPDYKASFLATLGPNAEFYDPYQENAKRWYLEAQRKVVYWNHAIANPPVDRNLPHEEIKDVVMRVEKETDAGIVVTGAKVVATGSALTQANFVGHYGLPLKGKEYAMMFTTPMNAPGVKLISRVSYELQAAVTGSPFDYPLSSRFDENDAILVLDKVLVPWENVFAYGDPEKVNQFGPMSGVTPRMTLHGVTRLAVKLDFIAGLLLKAVALTGTKDFRGVQVKVGEVIGWRNLFWGISDAMVKSPHPWVNGLVQPNFQYGAAFRIFGTEAYPAIKGIIEKAVGSGLIYLNSNAADFKRPEVRGVLDKYVRGSGGADSVERVKLMKLLWDAVGSEFGSRHELYERNYLGNDEGIRFETMLAAEAMGDADRYRGFADQCLAEYDLDGWVGDAWVNPGDVSIIGKNF